MSHRPFSPVFLLAVLLTATPLAALQDEDPVAQALELYQKDDVEGAIELLEVLRERGEAPPSALAALGTFYLEIGLDRDALDLLAPLAERDDANPAVLYNAGRAALQLGEEERAEAYLKRSVEVQPVSPAARLLGLRLGARGETVASYQLLRPWALTNPDDHEARLAAAVGALHLERLPEAEELLQDLDEENPRVRLLRADLALKQRQPAAAAALLEPFAESPPPEMAVDLLVLLASAYMELGRSADAVELLAPRAEGLPRLTLYLARARYQGGDADGALATLKPFAEPLLAADAPPAPPQFRDLAASVALEQGRLLVAAGRSAEAVPALLKATEWKPWSREAWQELARAYAAAGETEKAAAAAKKLQEIAAARESASASAPKGRQRLEDTTGSRLAEALEWQARGDGEKALDIVRQEISLAPRDPRPRLLEVRLLLGLDRGEEALESIAATLELVGEHPDVVHVHAVALLGLGRSGEAEQELRRALEIAPRHVPAKNDLALVLARRGERDEARRLWEEILAENPADELAKARLMALDAEQ